MWPEISIPTRPGGPNADPSNPWFGPSRPGVIGGSAHSGSKCWQAKIGVTNCEDTLNLAYRTNVGYPYRENIFLDWWFYDPATATPTGFCDGVELGSYSDIPGDTDYNSANGGTALQRTYVGGAPGAAQGTGYDSTLYQARVMNATGAYNTNGWFNIPDVTRSVGWHHARILVGGLDAEGHSPISIYLDDMDTPRLTATTTVPTPSNYNCVKLWGNTGVGTWGQYVDDLVFGKVPSIVSVSVSPNQYVSGDTVDVSYTSAGTPSAYQLAVDNGPYVDITGFNPYTLDISGMSYGPHTVKIMSQDDCGAWTGPATATFTIDRSSIREWAICGFYAYGGNTAAGNPRYADDMFPPDGIETLMAPKTGQTYNGKAWFNYTSTSPILDLNAAYGSVQDYGNSYLGFYAINSGSDITDAYLTAGSDDGIKVWVNGNLVLGHDIYRGCTIDSDISNGGIQPYPDPEVAAPFTLKSGWNRVLIKITQGSTNQNAQFRFCAADRTEPAWLSQLTYALTEDTPPTGSMLINGGAESTANGKVTLSVTLADSQSGIGYMSFSNDNVTFSPKEPYAPTKAWSLLSGPPGTRTVYAKLYDCAQNELDVSDTIYSAQTYSLTTVPVPTAGGTTTGDGTFPAGSSTQVSATGNTGYHFTKWTDDAEGTNTVSTSASFNYTMPSNDVTLYAWFDLNNYNLSVSANAGGTTTSDPASGPVAYTTPVTATAVPDQCMRFVKWTDETGATVSTSRVYTFTMPTHDVTLIANFEAVPDTWSDSFESYNVDAQLDFQGWWVPDYPNGNAPADWWVLGATGGITPHTGTKMARVKYAETDGNMINLAYHIGGGVNLTKSLMADWWFYDPAGSGSSASAYRDWFCLSNNNLVPGDAEAPANGSTYYGPGWIQRCTVGGYTITGYNAARYQARIIGNGTADGAFNAQGWFNMSTVRSVGWHHGRIVVGPPLANGTSLIDIYIDDMNNPGLEKNSKMAGGFNFIELYATSAGTQFGAFDDITIDQRHQVVAVSPATAHPSRAASTLQVTFKSIGDAGTYAVALDDPGGPYTNYTSNPAAIDISGLAPGTHTIYAKAADSWICDDTTPPVSNTFTIDPVAQWSVIGFYPYGSESPNAAGNPRFADDMFPPDGTEATMCASTGKTYNGNAWFLYTPTDAVINFDNVYGEVKTLGDSYIFTYIINSGPALTSYLAGGSDDGIKAWVNGSVVLANDLYRGLTYNGDLSASSFTLNPGVNTLLVKETQGTGGEQVQVSLCNADKTPLTGLSQLTFVASDDAAPTGCGASAPATTESATVTFTLSGTDALSGMGYVQFSEDGTTYGPFVPFAPSVDYTITSGYGSKTIYVKILDKAHNAAAPIAVPVDYQNPATPVAKISDLWPMANNSGAYSLSGKTVTGVVGNAFWMEEEDRSSAIKVAWTGTMPAQDTKVSVAGTLDASSGQRVLVASSVTLGDATTPIKPLGVVEKSAGGAGVNADTPSITNGKGLYNVGMLVRIAGSVTASDSSDPNNKFFYLDDGSGLTDGANAGIKVLCGSATPPASGNKTVTGLVGVVGGKPVLTIRGATDIP